MKHKCLLAVRFVRYFLVKILSYFVPFRTKCREIWLFSERGSDAADNAFHLFCYVREHEPERTLYYILEKDSPYMVRVRETGQVLVRGSFKHLLLYFLPTVKISTHIFGTTPDSGFFASRYGERFLGAAGRQIFLQHGISYADIPALYAKNRGELSLFISGSAVEYEYLKRRYGYSENVLRCLGFARFDLLMAEKPRRQILFFPTWRASLSFLPVEDFEKTDYYRGIMRVLRHPRLRMLLEAYAVSLVFAPHFEMHRFASLFDVKHPHITVSTGDVGELVRSSAMLITDYSSVMFDFAYKEAPVLYADFFGDGAGNYGRGEFSLIKDGFGAICGDAEVLISELEKIFMRNLAAEESYLLRMRRYFPEKDEENRRRNLEAILEVAKREKV